MESIKVLMLKLFIETGAKLAILVNKYGGVDKKNGGILLVSCIYAIFATVIV